MTALHRNPMFDKTRMSVTGRREAPPVRIALRAAAGGKVLPVAVTD